LSLETQLSETRRECEQLNRQRDDLMQELGQVKDELTSEKQLRLNVCVVYLFRVVVVGKIVWQWYCYITVCLFVCLSVYWQNNSKHYGWIFMEFGHN